MVICVIVTAGFFSSADKWSIHKTRLTTNITSTTVCGEGRSRQWWLIMLQRAMSTEKARTNSTTRISKATTFFIHRMIYMKQEPLQKCCTFYFAIHIRPAFALNWYTHVHIYSGRKRASERKSEQTHVSLCSLCAFGCAMCTAHTTWTKRRRLFCTAHTCSFWNERSRFAHHHIRTCILPALVSCYFVFLFRLCLICMWLLKSMFAIHVTWLKAALTYLSVFFVLRVGHGKGVRSNGA